jgi:hypothetical protein
LFQLHEAPLISSLPRDNLFTSPLPSSSRASSFRDDRSAQIISPVSAIHLELSKNPELPRNVETDDEYLLTMRPYRPLDVSSTPISNSPSPPSSHQALQDPPDFIGLHSPRGTSPDVTSSPSEASRRPGGASPHTPARSPSPPRSAQRSRIKPPELDDTEIRPGPEDAEGSTSRWSFRSRKANQLQPYRFDRLQYKRQLQGNPDAVVAALSPPRRRSYPGSTTDQEFISDHDEECTQNTGEFSGLTVTGEEESISESVDTHRLRRVVPSSRAIPPTPTPPQWFLDGMNEISDVDGEEDIVKYLTDYSHKKPAAAEVNNNGTMPGVSRDLSSGVWRNLTLRLERREIK